LFAINPETSFFGVAPGTSARTNPNAMAASPEIASLPMSRSRRRAESGGERMTEDPSAQCLDWRGQVWTPNAEDHGTLEVFDLRTGKHLRTVIGFDTPHSILVRPGSPAILVTDGGKSMSKLLDAETYEKKATVTLTEGADSSAYDPDSNVLYVVTGGKDVNMKTAKIEAVDPDTVKKIGQVELNDDHVEAMAASRRYDHGGGDG
jgi:hypothetical protein